MGKKAATATLRPGGFDVYGRYRRGSSSNGFFTKAHVELESTPEGGTRITYASQPILFVRVFFALWFGVLTLVAGLLVVVAIVAPVKPAADQILGSFFTLAVMALAGLGAKKLQSPFEAQEHDLLIKALSEAVKPRRE